MSPFMSVFLGIVMFSILIFVHELGHFIAAKASGVQVNEFSMFMGPAIFKKQGKETLYTIRCIPIGGYCAMEGEDEDTDNPRSFQKAAWWKRLIILVSGAGMNFLLGILLFFIIALPMSQMRTTTLVKPCDVVASEFTFQPGDEIVEVNGETVYVYEDIQFLLNLTDRESHDFVVERNGERIEIKGIKPHHCKNEQGKDVNHIGLYMESIEPDLFDKMGYAWNMTIDNVRNVRLSLVMLFTGEASFQDMMGPVGIVDTMTDVATSSSTWVDGLMYILYFGAFIAVNLGVMNLLPIPALDGGRVVGLLLTTSIEAITRKKINPKYEGYIHGAGMILLLALMAVIMFKDVFMIFS